MGTQYNIKYYSSEENGASFKKAIDQLLVNINKEMSTYIKSSEISYFNNSARLSWVKVSKDFHFVAKYALSLAKKTEGVYDPTVGPLVNLWGFGPDGKRKVPKSQEILEARARVGYKKIELNDTELKIKKTVPGVYLDLSSVAKGFGVDKVSTFLDSQNITSYMVEIGGEVRTKGKKTDGSAWNVAIESADQELGQGKIQKVLRLHNLSLATSGNYRNFFVENGKRYSHTIDPIIGKPVINKLASVSIVDSRGCMQADALATALMVMGLEKALAFAEKQQLAAYFIFIEDGPNGQAFASLESKKFKELFGNE